MSSPFESIAHQICTEAQGIAALSHRIIQAGAWRYPLKGMTYFATHRSLWKPLLHKIAPLLALSIAVVTAMFVFTYIPQSFILTFFNGPWAWVTAIGLVLVESSTITGILARHYFLQEGMVEVYDSVLKDTGAEHLLPKRYGKGEGPYIREKAVQRFRPTSFLQEIKKSLFYAPLNLLPLIGPLLFLVVEARVQAPPYHDRYFHLGGFSDEQKREFVRKNKEGYLGFGIVALLLGLLPVVNVIMGFTNIVGAALWASDIEKGVYVSGVGLVKSREKEKEQKEQRAKTNVGGVDTGRRKSFADAVKEPATKEL